MEGINKYKQRLLIVDDSDMNHEILINMLGEEYEYLEAFNGREAIEIIKNDQDIDLILLDIMMPEVDGFGVIDWMRRKLTVDIPIIMISTESEPGAIARAYELGVVDYISRPFDVCIVRRRVLNTLMIYAKQKMLSYIVAEEIRDNQKNLDMMINVLSHIVEFRNGESGLHVLNIRTITRMLLKKLMEKTDKYKLSYSDITLISNAASLHDIGKIAIDEKILNKPGRLTDSEFEIIKSHSMHGAYMLKALPGYQEEPLIQTAYEICRWHHERYDGRGYPDGISGEEIPISAQVVALADVYDALTSERCYKKAFPHDKAIEMITNGECGSFNPLLLECLLEIGKDMHKELTAPPEVHVDLQQIYNTVESSMNSGKYRTMEEGLKQIEEAIDRQRNTKN